MCCFGTQVTGVKSAAGVCHCKESVCQSSASNRERKGRSDTHPYAHYNKDFLSKIGGPQYRPQNITIPFPPPPHGTDNYGKTPLHLNPKRL